MTEAAPLPEPTPVSQPFWQALAEHRIVVQYSPSLGPWVDKVPQILAVVQWDAGPRFSTELVDVDPGDVRVGMRVSPVFCDIPDTGVTLLRYRPERHDV